MARNLARVEFEINKEFERMKEEMSENIIESLR